MSLIHEETSGHGGDSRRGLKCSRLRALHAVLDKLQLLDGLAGYPDEEPVPVVQETKAWTTFFAIGRDRGRRSLEILRRLYADALKVTTVNDGVVVRLPDLGAGSVGSIPSIYI